MSSMKKLTPVIALSSLFFATTSATFASASQTTWETTATEYRGRLDQDFTYRCPSHNFLAIADPLETSRQKVSKAPITKETLSNTDYHISDYGSFKLTNGFYRNQETKVRIWGGKTITFGDVNNDGIKDAVTLLTMNGGGSGIFEHLAVIINEKGSLKNVATEYLGDRVVVKSISISAGKIKIVMLTQRPREGLCCPSLKVAQTYILQGNKLKRIGYKELPST